MDLNGSICYNCGGKSTVRPSRMGLYTTSSVEGKQVDKYINSYVIVAIFIILGIVFPIIVLWIGKQLRPNKPTAAKETTYESGNDPVGESQVRFNVRYYLYALMFVIFDVETVFLYPWAVAYKQLGLFALVEMVIFVGLLLVGLIYAWKKKVLKWNSI
jgi:NADH-quinone oxidoreductase subunit A